jgi:hypothetical protein
MLDRCCADAVVIFHMAFIGFAFAGGLLVLRWRRVIVLHLPAVAWATLVEVMHWHCPLTPLENYFRRLGGQAGYSEGFVEHYLEPILYPAGLTPRIQVMIGCGVFLVNAVVYALVIARWRRGRRDAAAPVAPPPASTSPAADGIRGQWA